MVTLSADNPYDCVVGPIGRRYPGGALSSLARAPGEDYAGRARWSYLVCLDLVAAAKNKISALARAVGCR